MCRFLCASTHGVRCTIKMNTLFRSRNTPLVHILFPFLFSCPLSKKLSIPQKTKTKKVLQNFIHKQTFLQTHFLVLLRAEESHTLTHTHIRFDYSIKTRTISIITTTKTALKSIIMTTTTTSKLFAQKTILRGNALGKSISKSAKRSSPSAAARVVRTMASCVRKRCRQARERWREDRLSMEVLLHVLHAFRVLEWVQS